LDGFGVFEGGDVTGPKLRVFRDSMDSNETYPEEEWERNVKIQIQSTYDFKKFIFE